VASDLLVFQGVWLSSAASAPAETFKGSVYRYASRMLILFVMARFWGSIA